MRSDRIIWQDHICPSEMAQYDVNQVGRVRGGGTLTVISTTRDERYHLLSFTSNSIVPEKMLWYAPIQHGKLSSRSEQAIAGCKDKTYREVLPLLESLSYGSPHAKVLILLKDVYCGLSQNSYKLPIASVCFLYRFPVF